ncbi:hypothetical protein IK146_02305 [Candidatus Saccharibacteria bacterium]|nr:hypothetical protein [Candidatus Saccharibacteria bacterium]
MNDLEYLNQISAKVNQPAQTGFFDKKMKIVLGALVGIVILFIIIAVAAGGSSKTESTVPSELGRLYTRSTEVNKTIAKYNSNVRSSSLRSNAAQLSTILTEVSSSSSNYLTATLGIDLKGVVMTAEDALDIENLNKDLETARLNGILDRKFASEMYYQIRYLLTIEQSVYTKTKDATLKASIDSSGNSLSILEESFRNFSESD